MGGKRGLQGRLGKNRSPGHSSHFIATARQALRPSIEQNITKLGDLFPAREIFAPRTGNQNRVVSCPWNFRHLENNVPFATIPTVAGFASIWSHAASQPGPSSHGFSLYSKMPRPLPVRNWYRFAFAAIATVLGCLSTIAQPLSHAPPLHCQISPFCRNLESFSPDTSATGDRLAPRLGLGAVALAALTPIVLASGAKADPIDMTTLPSFYEPEPDVFLPGPVPGFSVTIEEDPRIRVAETGGEPADGPSAVSGKEGGATISSVSGDVGAHVYFSFYWQAAGDFAASVGVPNADEIVGLAPSYLFDLCAGLSCGPVLESVSADKSNDYQNELSLDDLAAGYYTVGIIAEGVAADPPYSVVFATPVIGGSVSSVPEPTTWTMLIVGFAGICSFGWLKSQKRSQTCLVGIRTTDDTEKNWV